MVISEKLKNKVIIIAENNEHLAAEISDFLAAQGFVNIKIATDGGKVYEVLRPYYNEPEKIGLIVVNEDLPQSQVSEMCMTLSCNDTDMVIPFIIFRSEIKAENTDDVEDHDANCFQHFMSLPINYTEFLLVVEFQLQLKNERFLRYHQEERLINELAERKVVDAKLKYLVVHDELTSLLNRQNFEHQLRLILNRSNLLKQNGALLFIDLDRFSLINELEGFEVGDRLLVDVVSHIRKLASKEDLIARIGSDEFCVFLENRTPSEVKKFAERIRKTIYDYRFFSTDVFYSISVSIGISRFNTTTEICHPSAMISRARQACIMAKENGRNLVREYNENDISVQERRHDIYLVPLIRKALLEKQFFLVYQPVVDLSDGHISHYEALIRMKGNEEVIGPSDFIPVAERMGLIHSIDLWVVGEAIDFIAKQSAELNQVSIAINLSSVAFQDESLLPAIKEKLDLTFVDAKRITFEITETAAVENFEQTREMIMNLRALGCKFALDDFGAGFCSFNYLKTFPVDYVKIDGQFIRNLINDETDQVLVKSMAEIASKLGKKTIAEFVETPEIITKLKEMGIDYGQGYVFGKPERSLLSSDTICIRDLISKRPQAKITPLMS